MNKINKIMFDLLPNKFKNFLLRFPVDATKWNQATEEIVDIANAIEDELGINTNVGRSNTPSEWNTKHLDRIIKGYAKLSKEQKQSIHDRFRDWIGDL